MSRKGRAAIRVVGPPEPAVTEHEARIEALAAELREAREFQAATSDVLNIISRSTFDLAPVLDHVIETAIRLCRAHMGSIFRLDGATYRWAAGSGLDPAYRDIEMRTPIAPGPGTLVGRVALEGRTVQIADAEADPLYAAKDDARVTRARTMLGVPLLREGVPIGVIAMARDRAETFNEKEIALVTTFADQAVIAIENVRLFNETQEALEQQTATAEVLGVINSSPGDLTPVFDAMLDKAMRLCGAAFGILQTYDGRDWRPGAMRGVPRVYGDFLASHQTNFGPGTGPARIIAGEKLVHDIDITDSDAYRAGEPNRLALADLGGARSVLIVPLKQDRAVLGVINIYRQEVRAFSDKEIALLQNFAAQAVIAIENARLLTETRESLERQTATSDILGAIAAAPGDAEGTLRKIAETTNRLFNAAGTSFRIAEGDEFTLAIGVGRGAEEVDAALYDPAKPRFKVSARTLPGTVIRENRQIHLPDLDNLPPEIADWPGPPILRAAGTRTLAATPLRRGGRAIGSLHVYRHELRPFTAEELRLLQSFADQAVIAIENARLITETREALEQQTATAEVLGVINSSPGDLKPVFEAILDKAHALCGAERGTLFLNDGGKFKAAVAHGYPEDVAEHLRTGIDVDAANPRYAPLFAGNRVHIPDLSQIGGQTSGIVSGRGGVRTNLLIPLIRDEEVLGMISCNRTEVRPFSDKEIALIENFAAQAVIAIDNARLLDEIRQRQAELRVTFDNMADGVAMFDEDQRLAAWNRNFQELVALPDEVAAARPTYAEFVAYLTERGEFGAAHPETELARLRAEVADHSGYERTRPDGTILEVRHNSVPDGGFVLIYSDITERKRSEAEIHAARDTAEAALRELKLAQANLIQAEKMASLGQLTAGIAHEIKNPLNFVNNFAMLSNELLGELKEIAAPALATLDKDTRAEVDETMAMLSGNLDKIAEHGRRADGIVKSMLAHSRGSSGDRQSVDLNALAEEALNLAYHGARAQDQSFNITLERDFAAGIAPVEVAPQDVTRVLLNLIGNGFHAAHKRMKEGGDSDFRPALRVATRELGDAVEVRVRDNGTGIPPENRGKLFQPFFTTKPTGEGTGLGLSISYDIVTQQHGGTITVESEVGAFTEFTVRLPRAEEGKTVGRAV